MNDRIQLCKEKGKKKRKKLQPSRAPGEASGMLCGQSPATRSKKRRMHRRARPNRRYPVPISHPSLLRFVILTLLPQHNFRTCEILAPEFGTKRKRKGLIYPSISFKKNATWSRVVSLSPLRSSWSPPEQTHEQKKLTRLRSFFLRFPWLLGSSTPHCNVLVHVLQKKESAGSCWENLREVGGAFLTQ